MNVNAIPDLRLDNAQSLQIIREIPNDMENPRCATAQSGGSKRRPSGSPNGLARGFLEHLLDHLDALIGDLHSVFRDARHFGRSLAKFGRRHE